VAYFDTYRHAISVGRVSIVHIPGVGSFMNEISLRVEIARQLTTLVPLLICRTALSAVLLSVKEAWKAVFTHSISKE